MPNADHDRIIAVVSPLSRGGTSLFDMAETIDAKNVQQFYSEASVIAAASVELRKAGFEVLDGGASPVTISIAGSRKLFEDVFAQNSFRRRRPSRGPPRSISLPRPS
jgi:hypothetical protein